jgi:hypothetical protein
MTMALARARPDLLTVFGQNPLAGAAEPGAMLLETVENSRVALVHHRPAKARDVARAGVMALLCQCRRSGQNERQNEENPGHLMAPYHAFARSKSAAATFVNARCRASRRLSMIRKSVQRFSEKIMRKQ